MAILQPASGDKTNSPDHSLMHRIIAVDPAAPVESLTVDSDGDTSSNVPYGCFISTVNQTIANTTTAYPITYTNALDSRSVTLSNNSRINIAKTGDYLITFSVICRSSAPNKTMDIWLTVDGTNIANSNTHFSFVGSANEKVVTVTFIQDFTAGQYFELVMCADDTGNFLLSSAATTNPTRPASPSIILTVNKIGTAT
jgi:hypothetical protein